MFWRTVLTVAAIILALSPIAQSVEHTVSEGETLSEIVYTYYPDVRGSWSSIQGKCQEVAKQNNIDDIDLIIAGSRLNLDITDDKHEPLASAKIAPAQVKPLEKSKTTLTKIDESTTAASFENELGSNTSTIQGNQENTNKAIVSTNVNPTTNAAYQTDKGTSSNSAIPAKGRKAPENSVSQKVYASLEMAFIDKKTSGMNLQPSIPEKPAEKPAKAAVIDKATGEGEGNSFVLKLPKSQAALRETQDPLKNTDSLTRLCLLETKSAINKPSKQAQTEVSWEITYSPGFLSKTVMIETDKIGPLQKDFITPALGSINDLGSTKTLQGKHNADEALPLADQSSRFLESGNDASGSIDGISFSQAFPEPNLISEPKPSTKAVSKSHSPEPEILLPPKTAREKCIIAARYTSPFAFLASIWLAAVYRKRKRREFSYDMQKAILSGFIVCAIACIGLLSFVVS